MAHGALHHLEQGLHRVDDGLGSGGQQQLRVVICLCTTQLSCLQLVQTRQQLETVVPVQLVLSCTCSNKKTLFQEGQEDRGLTSGRVGDVQQAGGGQAMGAGGYRALRGTPTLFLPWLCYN